MQLTSWQRLAYSCWHQLMGTDLLGGLTKRPQSPSRLNSQDCQLSLATLADGIRHQQSAMSTAAPPVPPPCPQAYPLPLPSTAQARGAQPSVRKLSLACVHSSGMQQLRLTCREISQEAEKVWQPHVKGTQQAEQLVSCSRVSLSPPPPPFPCPEALSWLAISVKHTLQILAGPFSLMGLV